MSDGEEPRHTVNRRTEVVSIMLLCRPGVQCHPHLQRWCLFPVLAQECPLGLQGRLERLRSGRECGTEGVPDGLEDVASAFLYGPLEDLVVASEGRLHRRSVLLPQLDRTLYVGEEKGDRACGQIGHELLASSLS